MVNQTAPCTFYCPSRICKALLSQVAKSNVEEVVKNFFPEFFSQMSVSLKNYRDYYYFYYYYYFLFLGKP